MPSRAANAIPPNKRRGTRRSLARRRLDLDIRSRTTGPDFMRRTAPHIAARIPSLVRGMRHVDAGCTGCDNPACAATHRLIAKVQSHDCDGSDGTGSNQGCHFCQLWQVCCAAYALENAARTAVVITTAN